MSPRGGGQRGVEWAPSLPNHWGSARLQWLATIYAGGTPSKDVPEYWSDGTIPWLNSGSVNDWEIRQPSTWITEQALASSSARWIPPASVVIALAGQGKTKGTAARLAIRSTSNQSMAAVVPGANLEHRYLHYWLTCNYESIRNLGGGDNRDGLNLQHIGSIECPVPSLEEQRRIADFLDDQTTRIGQIIAARQQQLEWLGTMETAEFDDLFSGAPQQLGFLLAQSPSYGVLVPQFVEDEGVPFLRVNDLARMSVLSSADLVRISREQSDEYRRTVTCVGDVLVSVVGSTDKAAVVTPEFAGCNVARAVARLVPRSDVPAGILLGWTKSSAYRDHARLATGSDTAQPTLNMGDLKKFPVALPEGVPMAEVALRADRISERARSRGEHLTSSISLLQEFKRSLISAAVSGEFEVSAASGRGVPM